MSGKDYQKLFNYFLIFLGYNKPSLELSLKIMKLNALDIITIVLVVIGGLNWGLVGLFSFDLVAAIFGTMSWISRIVYVLVGLSAIYLAVMAFKFEKLEILI